MDSKMIACFISAFLFAGCGQDVLKTPFQATPSINPILAEPGNGSDSGSPFGEILKRGVFSVAVNRALIGVATETPGNHYALLRTLPGVNSPGAYYGLGLGNKAQLGIGLNASNKAVTSFGSLSLKVFEPESEGDSDVAHLSLNLLIDLNCDPLNPNYRVATTMDLIPREKGKWETFLIRSSDRVFRWVRTSGALRSLGDLLKGNPLACFTASDVFDLGMKRDQKLTPIQLVYGDRYYFKSTSIQVDDLRLEINGETETEEFEP